MRLGRAHPHIGIAIRSGRPATALLPHGIAGRMDADDLAGDAEVLNLRTRLATDCARL
jgi:hypothetical protein